MFNGETLKKTAQNILPPSIYKRVVMCRALSLAAMGKVKIEFLVVCVGQACNFKCRDCGNFAPHSPKEFRRYKVDDIIESLNIIIKHANEVRNIQIQGGEPFLYTDLAKLVKYLGERKRVGGVIHSITIATNGSILPSNELLQLFRENDVEVRISDYNIVHDQAQMLKKKCEEMGVHCFYHEFASKQTMWYSCGDIDTPPEKDEKVILARYRKCSFHSCLTLERGELSYCSRATNSYIIQNFERKDGDYLKVCDEKGFKKQLVKYLIHTHPMEACRYCNGTADRYLVPPAIQIEEKER